MVGHLELLATHETIAAYVDYGDKNNAFDTNWAV